MHLNSLNCFTSVGHVSSLSWFKIIIQTVLSILIDSIINGIWMRNSILGLQSLSFKSLEIFSLSFKFQDSKWEVWCLSDYFLSKLFFIIYENLWFETYTCSNGSLGYVHMHASFLKRKLFLELNHHFKSKNTNFIIAQNFKIKLWHLFLHFSFF